MRPRILVAVAVVAALAGVLYFALLGFDVTSHSAYNEEHSGANFEGQILQYFRMSGPSWIEMNATSVFKVFVNEGDYEMVDNRRVYNRALFELNPAVNYDGVRVSEQDKIIVVYPIFTATAYSEPGFYTFYREECDQRCLTVGIKNGFPSQANPNAVQVLHLLGYRFITDIDVDRNPEILREYDKVIILHNEYVTKKEFDAITAHPNVVYLYPNALYAEVKVDYAENTITLLRGHNYPKPEIINGFDWEYDNTPLEYEECVNMSFYRIVNGWMLNCYPENAIYKSMELLKTIKSI